jgi:hypothetical protein
MKYDADGLLGHEGIDVRPEVDVPQFNDLEVVTAIEVAREFREQVLFKIGIGGSIISSPVLHKGVLYFGCNDKNLYAVSTGGEEIWRFHTSLSYQSPIDLELPGSREASHQVIWSRKTPETERYGKESPGLSDYGEGFEGYQSTGIRTTYMAGHERPYKSKRKYG